MKVHELMNREVHTCTPDSTGADAARIMWEHDCGVVPVVAPGDGKLVGMITDRDLCMAAFTTGADLERVLVESAMCHAATACHPQDDVYKTHHLMRDHQVRRLPVLDDEGRVVGLISLNDLALAAEHGRKRDEHLLDVGKTLVAVSRHRALAST